METTAAAKTKRRVRVLDDLRELIVEIARREAHSILKEYLPTARKRNGAVTVKHAVDPARVRAVLARWNPRSMRLHREKLGLSRPEYATLMGVSPITIYMWETGRNRPKDDKIARFRNLEEGRSLKEREQVAVPRAEVRRGRPPTPVEAAPDLVLEDPGVAIRRAKKAAYMKQRREKLMAEGLCTLCAKVPARPGTRACEECAAKQRKWTSDRYHREHEAPGVAQA